MLLWTQTFRVYYPSSVWETVNNPRCSKLSKVKARARKKARTQFKCSWNWCWFHLVARFPNKKSASFQPAYVGCCFRYISAYPATGHLRYWGPWSWNVCHRETRSVVAYASQMFSKSTSEASPSFTDVKMGTSGGGYTVHKIFWHAVEMIMDGKDALRASYRGDWIDVLASPATRALTCTRPRPLRGWVFGGVHQHVS